jgi:hypothetical protein
MSFSSRLRSLLLVALSAGLCAAPIAAGCGRSDSNERPEDTVPQAGGTPASAPAPTTRATSINLGRDVAGDLRQRAEGGDVPSMMVLGRFHESRNTDTDRAEARKWYKKAAEAGEPTAAEAIRNLEAREGRAAASSEPQLSIPQLPETFTTDPSVFAAAPTTSPGAAADAEPIDPTKTRWKDLLRIVDTSNFLKSVQSTDEFKFLGAAASPDRGISLFAAGQSADDLVGVSAIIRVRNRLDPAGSDRVAQMATIAAHVTRDNVSKLEMINWIKQYLTTGKSSEPILRNGWRIIISGPAAEGRQDPNDHLGAAVLVEIKR